MRNAETLPFVTNAEAWMEAPGRRWLQASALLLAVAVLAPSAAAANVADVPSRLTELGRALAASRTQANVQAMERYADDAPGTQRHLALYALGTARYEARAYAQAEQAFAGIPGDAGWLGEYAAYFRARCIVLAEDFERSLAPLERFEQDFPDSRYQPAALRLHIESLLRLKRLDEARTLVSRQPSSLEEPVRLYLAGRVEHVDGNLQRAISLYRAAYYFFPYSDQAEAAETHLNRLRAVLGSNYPDAPPSRRLTRAQRLYEGRSYAGAHAEFGRAIEAGLSAAETDRAKVRMGAADYHRRRTTQAYSALAKLRPEDPEASAERLYYLLALERRKGMEDDMLSSLGKLADQHPRSPWYEEGLLSTGNYYYLKDDRREYVRWFSRLYAAFPTGKHAAYAHWKICWRAWLDSARERRQLLTEHLERYAAAPTAAGAIYWLGRLHEEEVLPSEAEGHYRAILRAFPHYYYAQLARERLSSAAAGALADKVAQEIVERLPPARELDHYPEEKTRALVEIGQVQDALGLKEAAATTLQLVDYRQPDSHLAGLALGRLYTRDEEHYRAIRAMKRYVFGYLRMPTESLETEYWRYLFPLGWEKSLRARSERHNLDPYLVAALIRQESEFNPGARSHAGALGLMQIMPNTGRTLFRRLGIPGFSSRKLTSPDLSLRLGTFHLKEVLAEFGGNLEYTLAGYNAGERRVPQWLELGPFEETAEFVETIPFSETRGYVQSVLRNRAIYRSLYGD